jgi:hypothetical protein
MVKTSIKVRNGISDLELGTSYGATATEARLAAGRHHYCVDKRADRRGDRLPLSPSLMKLRANRMKMRVRKHSRDQWERRSAYEKERECYYKPFFTLKFPGVHYS